MRAQLGTWFMWCWQCREVFVVASFIRPFSVHCTQSPPKSRGRWLCGTMRFVVPEDGELQSAYQLGGKPAVQAICEERYRDHS